MATPTPDTTEKVPEADAAQANAKGAPAASGDKPAAGPATTPAPVDDLVTTHHTLRVGRRTLRYTAMTGRVVLLTGYSPDAARRSTASAKASPRAP